MYKGGEWDGGNQGEDNKQKRVLCIGAIITLIVAAIVLIVVLVPNSGESPADPKKPVNPVDGECTFN